MAIKKGSTVRQVLPSPIEGTVTDFDVCKEEGRVLIRVEWPDADGDGQPESRWFSLDEVEEVA